MLPYLIQKMILRRLEALERAYSHDVGYMREMLALSPRAFRVFGVAMAQLAGYREDTPAEALYAAKLAAALVEDCGPCAQLALTMAEKAGVPAETLRLLASGDLASLPEDASLGYRFARAVMSRGPDLDRLRDAVVARWGARALTTLAIAVAVTRVYPTIKYALGHGQSCQRLRVAGQEIPRQAEAAA